ncbi:D-aspartate oxidase-like [Amphiura filiformis]|uniref:D-aspartate oxidase-like n=1 Tax=Amphiura filiformis TaxID=82378 RepID=UPI003B222C66
MDFDVVVNCSGVNSYHLVNDRKVVPIRGQAIKVRAPWHKVMVAVFHDNFVTHSTPKSNYVILGATKEAGRWDSNVYSSDRVDIFERNCKFVPSLRNAEILSDFASVRPGRSSIRVEKEIMKFGPHRIPVVHNYGHGGSGITFHWGCAQDAAKLVQQCLQDLSNLTSKL